MLDGKKVLITGHTGQVGAAIANAHARRCEMWGLARYTRPGSREESEAMGVLPIEGDITSGDFSQVPDDFDYVLHFAANTKPGTADVGMAHNAEGTGFLMHHCRKARGFLYVGATGCYLPNSDMNHVYKETDHLGGQTLWSPRSPNYGPTKVAAEGVVRTLAQLYGIPSIIARLDVSYGGPYDDGGLPGQHLLTLVEGRPIRLPPGGIMHSVVHEDDLADHIEPLLKAASVPATIVNWGGDEAVNAIEWVKYLGEIMGRKPEFHFTKERPLPNCITDTTKGREIGLTWKVRWKDGMRRMVQIRHPEVPLRPTAPAD